MQQPSQSQSTPAPMSGSQAWGTQPQQIQPSLPDLLSASMSSFPAAFYQQQQFQALQQHLHNNQLSQFQVPASDPRAQAVLQQQQRFVSQPQQQQSAPALGSLVHALGGQLPPHSAPGASSGQPHVSQSAAPTSSSSQAQHAHESQHPQSSTTHLAGQLTSSHPSQVARPVVHTLAKQPAHGSHGIAAPEPAMTRSPTRTAQAQPTVAAANVGQAVSQQNAALHGAATVYSASHPHAVARPATQAAGHPSMPHAHVTSQPATQAVPQPSIFRPPTHVSRPATDAAEQSSGFRSQAMSRPTIEAAGQVADPQPQVVRRPATEAAERPLLFRPQAVSRPATEAAAQHTVYRPQAAYRPATDAASLPAAARPKAVHRPATEAAQQSEPSRSVSLSRVASEAAEQALETRPSGVPAAGRLVWAKLARYPWWPAEILTASDPYIPEGEEPPRLGAVPVRFFGTYAFAWIESKRAIEPYDQEHAEHARESRQTEFLRGVGEANHYQATGELPQGFALTLQQLFEEQQAAKAKAAAKAGKGNGDDQQSTVTNRKQAKRIHDDPVAAEHARHRAVTARKLRLQRQLGLAPPAGSPFASATAPCLDGFAPVAAHLGWVVRAANG